MLVADHLHYVHPGPASRPYDLSFVARPGEITLISGASGAGKSTLLDLVAGFLIPQSGRLDFEERSLLGLAPEQRPVSILFQSDSVFEHLSTAANLDLGLPRHMPRMERAERRRAALGEVGLSGKDTQLAGTLSGGEKQRVALARTLLRNRPILLLDEPFSALDDETGAEIRALVRRLTTSNRWTTLLVSHNSADATGLADANYLLADGRLTLLSEGPAS